MYGVSILLSPLSSSCGFSYILLAVDYVSKWVEAKTTKTDDSQAVVSFIRANIFARFGILRVIISDQGTHFCNRMVEALIKKYGVNHELPPHIIPKPMGRLKSPIEKLSLF
jgi:hypothetical protein